MDSSSLERLMQPPWLVAWIAIAAVFSLWFAYLLLPQMARVVRLLANAFGRRNDGRTLGWLLAVVLLVSALFGAYELVTRRLEPELAYYVQIAIQLVLVVVGVLAIVSFITWATMVAFEAAGRPLMNRGYLVFVGWHLLRSHRESRHEAREYQGGPVPGWGLLVAAGVACFGAAWFARDVAWPALIGDLCVTVDAMRVGLLVCGALLVTWPLRRTPRVGTIDRLDRAETRLRNLPDLLRVTATTFISIVGVGVGIWALIVVLSVMAGFETDLRSKILATNPHVVIQDEEPMAGIQDYTARLDELRAIDGVIDAIPYVQGDVIVTSRENRNVSLTLRGIDPQGLAATEHHLSQTVVGGALDNLLHPERVVPTARWELKQTVDESSADHEEEAPADESDDIEPIPIPGPSEGFDEGIRPGVLLGEELANSLRVGVGGEVTILSPRDDAGFLGTQPRARTFRVAGIFRTGMYEFDLKLAYVRLSEAQRFFHMQSDINRIELRLTDADRSDDVLAAIAPMVDAAKTLEALDWKRLNRNLFSALALEKIVMFIVLGFIILVASFNVIGCLVMIIMEKTREIAILESMGATSREVRRLFLVLGGFIGGIGSAAGLLVGLLTCWFIQYVGVQLPRQYYIEKLPVHIDAATIGTIFLAGILLCLLATLYPAYEAARIQPVEGLRFD